MTLSSDGPYRPVIAAWTARSAAMKFTPQLRRRCFCRKLSIQDRAGEAIVHLAS
jgi:hypothetical protein